MTKITKAVAKLVRKTAKTALKTVGICYTVEAITDMGNHFKHTCFSYAEAISWMTCYAKTDKVIITGFGGLYVISARG